MMCFAHSFHYPDESSRYISTFSGSSYFECGVSPTNKIKYILVHIYHKRYFLHQLFYSWDVLGRKATEQKKMHVIVDNDLAINFRHQ